MLKNTNDNYCQIVLPSGGFVSAVSKEYYISVSVYLPAQDRNNTEGLCGKWSGNRQHDLKYRDENKYHMVYNSSDHPTAFIHSWRLVYFDY